MVVFTCSRAGRMRHFIQQNENIHAYFIDCRAIGAAFSFKALKNLLFQIWETSNIHSFLFFVQA